MPEETLPNAERAVIPIEKLRDYLLSVSDGKGKARLFQCFTADNAEALGEALRKQHLGLPASEVPRTDFGRKFVIAGQIVGLNGGTADVQSVWMVRDGEDFPRLLTAYRRRRNV